MTDTEKGEVIKDASKSARHDARGEMMAGHPELGAGSVPPPPPGCGMSGGGQSTPVQSVPSSGVPPLPLGYALAH